MLSKPSGNSIDSKPELSNISGLSLLRPGGKMICLKAWQPWKTSSAISSKPSGKFISSSFMQPLNAPTSIRLIVDGKTTFLNWRQSSHNEPGISVIPSGSTNSSKVAPMKSLYFSSNALLNSIFIFNNFTYSKKRKTKLYKARICCS